MITVPNIDALPTPMQKSSLNTFVALRETFLAALQTFDTQLDAARTAMNTICSGLQGKDNAPVYDVVTEYNWPDVVIASDGFKYRCLMTGVTGVDPTDDQAGAWVRLTSPYKYGTIRYDRCHDYAISSATMNCDGSSYDVMRLFNPTVTSCTVNITLPVGRTVMLHIENPGIDLTLSFAVTDITTYYWKDGEVGEIQPEGVTVVTITRISGTAVIMSLRSEFILVL